ncbi:MAG: DUF2939 domain-containing protein [Caulobacteraceae bacterium]
MTGIVTEGPGAKAKSGGPLVIGVVAVAALALAGAYFGSPYLAVNSVAQAAKAGDTDKLNRLIDFPAVRDGLKADLSAAFTQRLNADASTANGGLSGLAAQLLPALVGRVVDTIMTPAGVAAMIDTGRAPPVGGPPSAGPNTNPGPKLQTSVSWRSLGQVSVDTQSDKQPGASLIFTRQGLFAWKLTRIGLPSAALADLRGEGGATPAKPLDAAPPAELAATPPPAEPPPVADAGGQPSPAPVASAAPPSSGAGAQPASAALRLVPRPPPPPARPMSTRELLGANPDLAARERRVQAMFENARARDVNGEVDAQEAAARGAWEGCRDKPCLQRWYANRERALSVWEGN